MTRKQLRAKTRELLRQTAHQIDRGIEKAIMSGSMNIEDAKDDYYLPRLLMTALLKNEYEKNQHWLVEVHGVKAKKEVNNIEIML